jgi:hypothetical protein
MTPILTMPMYAQGKDDVFVGRIRRDEKPTKYVEYVDCSRQLKKRCCYKHGANCRISCSFKISLTTTTKVESISYNK